MKEQDILTTFCKRLVALDFDIFGIAKDEAKWITVHPNGPDAKGRPVLIDEESGKVLGGMGGKFNGETLSKKKSSTSSKQSSPKKLSQGQIDAIDYYASGNGMYINQSLRQGESLDEHDTRFVADLDEALDVPLGEQTLFRSVDAKVLFGDMSQFEFSQLQDAIIYGDNNKFNKKIVDRVNSSVGKTYTDNGYMSTTRNQEIADDWGDFTGSDNPIVLKIKTNKNTKGRNISEISPKMKEAEENDPQEETLLSRNQKYRLTRVYGENGNIYADVELL